MRPLYGLAVTALIFLAAIQLVGSAKGRGRGRSRKGSGSSRFIFFQNTKRKDYYDNPNGAVIEKASHFDYEFFLGHKIVFVCVAKGLPRPKITWFKDGVELQAHPYSQISEWQQQENRIKSKLEIDPARQMDSGNYECQADNKYAIDQRSFRADFSSLPS
ncbi:immunoglobulin domain-containing protein oig-4-like isoform X2 [Varroa jacobsoni]|uniref:Ig-like domain-containing protein n=1 Tax=Varroa destructor TaxID=109461 RepID=A0A7M7KNY2_VARDE|nr:immunoglobulin domain-containing protein oig-4-like isoform X2 [Varroa destructor]XP_022701676.1 immunoglobulin domain-containing protein oig-4-like isoform X2 [Varroa jacobsoni]